MRTFLTSTLIFLSIVSFSQGSYQIVDTTKTWNTIGIGNGILNVMSCGGTKTNWFRDISVPGDQYLDVLESDDSLQQEWYFNGEIREDTVSKQVFYNRYGETEGLIYDFSLEAGDTVHIDNQYLEYQDASLIVDSIDMVDIYGVVRKRFLLFKPDYSMKDPYYPDEIWIEGIGSNYGIMYSGLGAYGWGGGTVELLCVSQNDNTIYMDTLFNECYIDTFYPQILQWSYDTAYVNTPYEFQLQVDTGDAVSWSLFGYYIPEGFAFDSITGLLTGTPTQAGKFACVILAENNDLNWFTDIIYEDIIVVLPTEINEADKLKEINIYPNPFNTELNIDVAGPEGHECRLEIFTSDGKLIRNIGFSGSIKPDLSRLSNGLYLVLIKDRDGNVLYNEWIVKGN